MPQENSIHVQNNINTHNQTALDDVPEDFKAECNQLLRVFADNGIPLKIVGASNITDGFNSQSQITLQ